MKTLAIELRKEKRTGVIPVLLAVGVLGAAYAFVNFLVRKQRLWQYGRFLNYILHRKSVWVVLRIS